MRNLLRVIACRDIVGYTTKAVNAKTFYLMPVQFNETGAALEQIPLIKLISTDIEPMEYADCDLTPQILVKKSGAKTDYFTYYWISDAGPNFDQNGWVDDGGMDLDDSTILANGRAFWFYSPAKAGNITLAGQVRDFKDELTLDIKVKSEQGFQMFSNPYPVALALPSTTVTVTPLEYADCDLTLQCLVKKDQQKTDYFTYYWIADAGPDFDRNGWVDDGGVDVEGTQIPANAGFWLYSPTNAGEITFPALED